MQACVPGDQPVYPVLRQLTSKQPIVTQIDGLLTPAECAHLVKTARGAGFEASEIEGRGEVRSLRTSRTADLPEDDPVVQCIERRLATIAGMPATSLEPLQATSYARGECYTTHHDAECSSPAASSGNPGGADKQWQEKHHHHQQQQKLSNMYHHNVNT